MSFWLTSTGEDTSQSNGSFESAGGDFEPIPAGQNLRAVVERCEWKELERGQDQGTSIIEITWQVIGPAEYANRKIFHKLWVNGKPSHKDPEKKRAADLRSLGAINVHAGKPLPNAVPTDQDLARLIGTMSMITVDVYEFERTNDDGSTRLVKGNWVRGVEATGSAPTSPAPQRQQQRPAPQRQATPAKPAAKAAQAPQQQAPADDFDDEIPF